MQVGAGEPAARPELHETGWREHGAGREEHGTFLRYGVDREPLDPLEASDGARFSGEYSCCRNRALDPADAGIKMITLWPDALLSPAFAPVEPVNGLRSVRVRLGQWWSPAEFPWDVSIALLRWRAGAVRDVEPPMARAVGESLAVPTVILTPLPWLHPSGDAETAVDAWLTSRRGTPSRAGVDDPAATWKALVTTPSSLADLRLETLGAKESVHTYIFDESAAGAGSVEQLRAVALEAPWHFLLSARLRAHLAETLTLNGPVLQGELLVAAHHWLHATGQGRGGGAGADAPSFPPKPTEEDIECGMFELLARRRGSKRLTHQKIANYIACLSPEAANDTIRRECANLRKAWRRKLAELPLKTILVPLPRVPYEPGLAEVDPAPGAWALEWLHAGRAPHLLRLVFGRQVDRLAWSSDPGQLAAGLVPFVEPRWTCRLEYEPAEASDCARIHWAQEQDPRARGGASSGFLGDVGEYLLLAVAPVERAGHAAERYLAAFTAGVATDPDARSIGNRLACARAALSEGQGGPIWETTLDACDVLAALRNCELASRGAASTDPPGHGPPPLIGSQTAAPAPAPSSRRQTGMDLLIYQKQTGLYTHGLAGELRTSKEAVLRALGAPDEPLPESMHLELLKAKERHEKLCASRHWRPPDWGAPLHPSAPAAGLLTGAYLRRWRGRRSQRAVATLLKASQSEISKAERRPDKALTAKLQRALAAELDRENS